MDITSNQKPTSETNGCEQTGVVAAAKDKNALPSTRDINGDAKQDCPNPETRRDATEKLLPLPGAEETIISSLRDYMFDRSSIVEADVNPEVMEDLSEKIRTASSPSKSCPQSKINPGDELGNSPRTLLRSCLTKVLVDTSLNAGKVKELPVGRLLSAKRIHIQHLSNDIDVLQRTVKDTQEKNRILERVNKRQEMALKRYHDHETELPRMLQSHRAEIRTLQEKLKKATEVNKKDAEKLKSSESQILKLTDQVNHLKELTDKKQLPERVSLSNRLSNSLSELQSRDKENVELNRRILILNKSFGQKISSERSKLKMTERHLSNLKEEHERTLRKLNECQKHLFSLQHFRPRYNSRTPSRTSTLTGMTFDVGGSIPMTGSVNSIANSDVHSNSIANTNSITRRFQKYKVSAGQTLLGRSNSSNSLSTEGTLSSTGDAIFNHQNASCIFDDTVIDLECLKQFGWTTRCQVSAKGRYGSDQELSSSHVDLSKQEYRFPLVHEKSAGEENSLAADSVASAADQSETIASCWSENDERFVCQLCRTENKNPNKSVCDGQLTMSSSIQSPGDATEIASVKSNEHSGKSQPLEKELIPLDPPNNVHKKLGVSAVVKSSKEIRRRQVKPKDSSQTSVNQLQSNLGKRKKFHPIKKNKAETLTDHWDELEGYRIVNEGSAAVDSFNSGHLRPLSVIERYPPKEIRKLETV